MLKSRRKTKERKKKSRGRGSDLRSTDKSVNGITFSRSVDGEEDGREETSPSFQEDFTLLFFLKKKIRYWYV